MCNLALRTTLRSCQHGLTRRHVRRMPQQFCVCQAAFLFGFVRAPLKKSILLSYRRGCSIHLPTYRYNSYVIDVEGRHLWPVFLLLPDTYAGTFSVDRGGICALVRSPGTGGASAYCI